MQGAATNIDFCVLIPCYNDEAGLLKALRSISYTKNAFAIVIVDDGSTQALQKEALLKAAPDAAFVKLIQLPANKGITEALNTGLKWILQNGAPPYIARLDCGDTCHPQRFYKQVTFLKAHTDVGLLGSWAAFANAEDAVVYTYKTPASDSPIRKAMAWRNVFIHPAVMLRTALLERAGLYPYQYVHAEDYAFFWQLLGFTKGAILPEVLVNCALRKGISAVHRRVQLQSRKKIVMHFEKNLWRKCGGVFRLYIVIIMPEGLLLRLKKATLFAVMKIALVVGALS